VALTTRNRGNTPFTLSQGLHTYFRVGAIGQVTVAGLDGARYIDKMDGSAEKVQEGAVAITGEVDRIYTGISTPLAIEDRALGRRIDIMPTGSASAVVWNPWEATARSMADLGDDDYRVLLCVETTNAGPDVVDVAPDTEHRLGATYSIAPLA
jgi:glucose-6-phosphate 1-epimerase